MAVLNVTTSDTPLNDLRQHAHGGAGLSSSALVGQQAGQDFFSNTLLLGIQNTVRTPLCNAS
jgi:hypothetical protein